MAIHAGLECGVILGGTYPEPRHDLVRPHDPLSPLARRAGRDRLGRQVLWICFTLLQHAPVTVAAVAKRRPHRTMENADQMVRHRQSRSPAAAAGLDGAGRATQQTAARAARSHREAVPSPSASTTPIELAVEAVRRRLPPHSSPSAATVRCTRWSTGCSSSRWCLRRRCCWR